MVTAVWGDWHIAAHFELNLPSLLSPNNLPAFVARHDLAYEIHTRQSDVARIAGSPTYRALRQLVNVSIHVIADDELEDPIAAHHKIWSRVTARAERAGCYALLMPPDVAWSDGSFRCLADLLAAGKKAIMMTYMRVVSETFATEAARFLAAEGKKGIPARALVSLALRHIHPIMSAYVRNSPYFPIHQEMMLWPVKDEGILVRVFAREMFLFDPRAFARNHAQLIANDFKASDIHFISDSDELFGISLTPLGKDVGWHLDRRAADPQQIAQWWLLYDSPANDLVASTNIRWHFAPITEKKWRAREQGADLLVRRAAIAREQQRVLRTISGLPGCSLMAVLYSSALAAGQIRFPRVRRERFLILVPENLAIESTPPASMLDPAFLALTLAAHIAPWEGDGDGSSEAMTLAKFEARMPLTLRSASGDTWTIRWGNRLRRRLIVETSRGITARVIHGPLASGRHIVCIIGDMLFAQAGSAGQERWGGGATLRDVPAAERASPIGFPSARS
jgi:hypothetical protein